MIGDRIVAEHEVGSIICSLIDQRIVVWMAGHSEASASLRPAVINSWWKATMALSQPPARGLVRAMRESASARRDSSWSCAAHRRQRGGAGLDDLSQFEQIADEGSRWARSSKRHARMSGSRMCQRARGATLVPTLGRAATIPLAAACGSPRDRRCARRRKLRSALSSRGSSAPGGNIAADDVAGDAMGERAVQPRAPGGEQRLDVDHSGAGGFGRAGGAASARRAVGNGFAGCATARLRDELHDRARRLGHAGDRADEMQAAMRQARP